VPEAVKLLQALVLSTRRR